MDLGMPGSAITGASSDIGAATADALVGAGARLVLGARRGERLTKIVERLGADRACAVTVDVRRPDDSRRLVAAAEECFGRLSVVLSAGSGLYGSILDPATMNARR